MAALAVLGLMTAASASAQELAPGATDPGPGTHVPLDFDVTRVGNKKFITITFEGGEDVHEAQTTAGAIFSGNTLTIIDSDFEILPGIFGSGNFAQEPSPETVAFWLTGGTSVTVTFSQPTSDVSLFYTSSESVTLEVFDAGAASLGTVTGPAQSAIACTGDSTGGSFCNWSPLSINLGTNSIASATFSGGANQTAFDDFKFSYLLPVANDDPLGEFVPPEPPAMDPPRLPFTNETVDIPISLLLANDTLGRIPNTVTVTAQPSSGGSATVVGNNIEYTSGPGFGGDDTFVYTLTDVDGDDDIATVTVTVDPSVAVAEPDPGDPDAPVTVLACADDPACDSPFDWTFEALQPGGGGTLEVECCTFPAARELLTTLSTRGDFYDTRNLDVVAEVKVAALGGSCVGVKRLLDEAAGLLVDDEVLESVLDFEILIPAWQRVSPNPLTYPTDTERNFLYNDPSTLASMARAALEWGVCAVAFDGEPDGISLTAENAEPVLGFETECNEDDLAFRPVTGGINIFPPQEDFPVVQPWTAECDRSRSGIRSSHVLYLLNVRMDTDLNGPKSTVSRVLGHLEDEIIAEVANVMALMNPADAEYLVDLSDLLATLSDAHKAVNAGRKAVRKGTANAGVAFESAVNLLDDFTCQALALPPRDNNARGLFTGRGLNARFMTCSYAQNPTSFDADKIDLPEIIGDEDDCLINAEVERTILDLPGDKCPIVRP